MLIHYFFSAFIKLCKNHTLSISEFTVYSRKLLCVLCMVFLNSGAQANTADYILNIDHGNNDTNPAEIESAAQQLLQETAIDLLRIELLNNLKDIENQSNNNSTLTVTTPHETRKACKTVTFWWWPWQQCEIVAEQVYPNNQNIALLSHQFIHANAVTVTLKGETEYSYDYIELNGQHYSGSLDQTVVIDGNQITLGFVSDASEVRSGVTITLEPISPIQTMIDALDSAQYHSDGLGFVDFINFLKTLEDTARGTDHYPQVKRVITKYQDNLHHIAQWLTAESQHKQRAAYEPKALMLLADHIQDQSLVQRLEHAHSTNSMGICLSGVSLECMVDFGHWFELKADIAMHLKQQGEALRTNHAFYGALQAVSNHLESHSHRYPLVQATSSGYNNDDEELADEEFEVGMDYGSMATEGALGYTTNQIKNMFIRAVGGFESASSVVAAIPLMIYIGQQEGDNFAVKLDKVEDQISGEINKEFKRLKNILMPFKINQAKSGWHQLYKFLSTTNYKETDKLMWLQGQMLWNQMGLNTSGLRSGYHFQKIVLDGTTYDSSKDKLQIEENDQIGHSWIITSQDKVGDGNRITIDLKDNRYIVRHFSNPETTGGEASEIKIYAPDSCSNNPNHYQLISHWRSDAKIVTHIDYDCDANQRLLAVVNKYSADSFDTDQPVLSDYKSWKSSIYFNPINYYGSPLLESIIHHQKVGEKQQYTVHPLRYKKGSDNQFHLNLLGGGRFFSNYLCDHNFLSNAKDNNIQMPYRCYKNGLAYQIDLFGDNIYADDSWRANFWNTFHHVAWENTNLLIPTAIGSFKTNQQGVIDQNAKLSYPLPVIGIEREAQGVKLITYPDSTDIIPDPNRDYIDLKMQYGQYTPNYVSSFELEKGADKALAEHGNDHVHYFENYRAIKLLLTIANADKFPITDNQLIEELAQFSGIKKDLLSSANPTTKYLFQRQAFYTVLFPALYFIDSKEAPELLDFIELMEKQASGLHLGNKKDALGSISKKPLFSAVKQLEKTDLHGFSIKNISTKRRNDLFISKQTSKQGAENLAIIALYKNHWLILEITNNTDLLDLRVDGLSWSDWHSMDHSGFNHYFDSMGLHFRENYKDYLLQVVKKSKPVLDMINSRDADKQGSGLSKPLDDTSKQAVAALWNAVIEYCPTESHHRGLEGGDKEKPLPPAKDKKEICEEDTINISEEDAINISDDIELRHVQVQASIRLSIPQSLSSREVTGILYRNNWNDISLGQIYSEAAIDEISSSDARGIYIPRNTTRNVRFVESQPRQIPNNNQGSVFNAQIGLCPINPPLNPVQNPPVITIQNNIGENYFGGNSFQARKNRCIAILCIVVSSCITGIVVDYNNNHHFVTKK